MSLSKYKGSCHCGAVKFTAELDTDQPALTCNCSMCGRSGTLLQFISPTAFTLEQGEDNLTDYQFNKNVIHHVFCKTCGIKPFARGEGPKGHMVAVNLRALEEVDPFAIQSKAMQFDGKSR